MLLDRPGNAAGADARYAMDAAGGRIEPDQVIPYVIGLDAAGDGVELKWHARGRLAVLPGRLAGPAPQGRQERLACSRSWTSPARRWRRRSCGMPSRPATSSSRWPRTS